MRDLQQIKNQVASECGWESWTSLYTAGKVTNGMIAQVAVRYAEEQKRDIMESLKELVSYLEAMHGAEEQECVELITAKKLINKHKQL